MTQMHLQKMPGEFDEFVYLDEAQLSDWGESRAGGAWIKLRLPSSEHLEQFRGLDTGTTAKPGHRFHMALRHADLVQEAGEREAEGHTPKPEKSGQPYGKQAAQLYASGCYNDKKLLAALGTDVDYNNWIRRQPSAVDGHMDMDEKGNRWCEAAHVRRIADGAGEGIKPTYATIPLTNAQHAVQHLKGESELDIDFEKTLTKYRREWFKLCLCQQFGVESLGDIEPQFIADWFIDGDLGHLLPKCYRLGQAA